jgi:hypothetical protein
VRGSGQWGEYDYDGHNVISGPSVGGIGRKTLIVSPHAAAIVNDDNNHCRGGGASCPPLSGLSCTARCPLSMLSILPTLVDGGGTPRVFGAWSYAWWKRRRSALLYSFVRF